MENAKRGTSRSGVSWPTFLVVAAAGCFPTFELPRLDDAGCPSCDAGCPSCDAGCPSCDAGFDGAADADLEPCVPGCPAGTCGPSEWARVCAGTFVMGSPLSEAGRYMLSETESQHLVTLTHDFEILSTEVTQEEFDRLADSPPAYAHPGCDRCAADSRTWHEAAAYCNALSLAAGLDRCYECRFAHAGLVCGPRATFETPYDCPGYRLPTEAEWEHAARAGTFTATYAGNPSLDPDESGPGAVLDDIAWWHGDSGGESHEVGTLRPNAWGLYDMLGNVNEWCDDAYQGGDYPPGPAVDPVGDATASSRATRGGYWAHPAEHIRAAIRFHDDPANRFAGNGFRPVRTLPSSGR